MKKSLLYAAVAALLLLSACGGEQPVEQVKQYSLEQFLKSTTVFGGSFNPDETKLLVTSNETGIYNAYVIDLATGNRTPLTESEDTTFAVSYFPNDERFLLTRDKGGNEINHLYMQDPDGNVTELTKVPEAKEAFFGWAYDFTSFFTQNNGRDQRYFDIYEWNLETLEPTMFWENSIGLLPSLISPDKRWIALVKPNTDTDSDILLVDRETGGEPILISEHEGQAAFSPEDFSVDSAYLYYTTTEGGEFAELKRYNLETGEHEGVYKADWDVSFAYFSRNGSYRVIGTNEDGYTKVQIIEVASGNPVELPELPAGQISGVSFSPSEKLMRFSVASDNMPSNIFLYDIEAGEVKQLTDNLNPEISAADLVAGEVVRFDARDGLQIPGILYKPKGAGPDSKVPALLWIHGGPGGQSRPYYSAERQFLINHGYAVFAVNNRGSSGYGKSFLSADDQRHGKEPLWDCVDAKDYLKEEIDWIDPDKIGIFGGSYGGYMVLAALAFEPEEFAVGVDVFGVANWIRTLQSIPPWWEAQREALYKELGNPETDEEMLRAISPVFHADKITKPLIILQGANDPRVLQAESDDMVAAIEAKGGIVEYVVFDDEGHGFTKNDNRIEGYNAVLKFLDKYLKGTGGEEAAEEATEGEGGN